MNITERENEVHSKFLLNQETSKRHTMAQFATKRKDGIIDAILNCINIVFNYYFFFISFTIAFSAAAFAALSFFCAAASAFALPAALAAFTAS